MRCSSKVMLMGLLSLVLVSPVMAWDGFGVDVSFGRGYSYDAPVVVRERVHTPPVVVSTPVVIEKRYSPVIVSRPCPTRVAYVAPSCHEVRRYVVRPHNVKVVVRSRHHH